MKRNTITKREVFSFKEKYCNENELVVDLIKNSLESFFIEPIIDVGAGIGDISYQALYQKRVTLLDLNTVSDQEHPCSQSHERVSGDFFDFVATDQIGTLFISHALQFLDEDIQKLTTKIQELNPQVIILILNRNDDFMGGLITWTEEQFEYSNPEVIIDDFPSDYQLIKEVPFQSLLTCPDYKILAEQVSYLMLIDLMNSDKDEALQHFLKTKLIAPEFTINQTIKIYSK